MDEAVGVMEFSPDVYRQFRQAATLLLPNHIVTAGPHIVDCLLAQYETMKNTFDNRRTVIVCTFNFFYPILSTAWLPCNPFSTLGICAVQGVPAS